ncbi:uncharacterized protein [Apostichopus japonicus]|uniref:uncharacterized protein isoform X2 n=1 Tax=Stichopus japonicus TaxID=307972 RepID=UPI003AB7CCC5
MRRATHKVNHSKFNIKIPAESSENKSKNELNNYTLFERRVIHLRRHKRELVLKIPTMAVVDIVYEITEEQEDCPSWKKRRQDQSIALTNKSHYSMKILAVLLEQRFIVRRIKIR